MREDGESNILFLESTHKITSERMLTDPPDLLFYLALALLPVDGTVVGIPLPFWTPLSPYLFLAYILANFCHLKVVVRRYLPFMLLPLFLMLTSFYGWFTIDLHKWVAVKSIGSVVLALACLASLEIALRIKRLPWKPMVTVLMVAYGFAFLVGVTQWSAIHLGSASITEFFERMMYRQYITVDSPWDGPRPQFLFAEPSYIGMHLYGVLLPVYWLIRKSDRVFASRVAKLIFVFAFGSLLMGSGVRIILDSLVALIVILMETTKWRTRRSRLRAIAGLMGIGGLAAAAVSINPRIGSIIRSGLDGDGSFSARIWQSLGPFMGATRQPLTLIFGYGAGNLADATHDGSVRALEILHSIGIPTDKPAYWFRTVGPDNMFTMNAYASFIVEFGLIGFFFGLCALIFLLTSCHSWNKLSVCWLVLVAYLYVQFEGYAFYAIPLYLWYVRQRSAGENSQAWS